MPIIGPVRGSPRTSVVHQVRGREGPTGVGVGTELFIVTVASPPTNHWTRPLFVGTVGGGPAAETARGRHPG
jgi:hypothetical protein